MAQNKTTATSQSVAGHIAAIPDDAKRKDCETLLELFQKITRQEPVMWGPSIIGYGTYHYRYESGREGDFCQTGFAARKNDLVVYLIASGDNQEELLAQLGKHRMGKSCLYIKRLSDIDQSVLEKLIRESVAEIQRRYGE